MANGQLTLTIVDTVAAAPAVQAIPGNSLRNYLLIQNIGGDDIVIGFDPTVTPTTGVVLAPGSTAPGQGGFFLWQDNFIPSNAIWVCSANASSVAVLEG
jgi:hypothetical protein